MSAPATLVRPEDVLPPPIILERVLNDCKAYAIQEVVRRLPEEYQHKKRPLVAFFKEHSVNAQYDTLSGGTYRDLFFDAYQYLWKQRIQGAPSSLWWWITGIRFLDWQMAIQSNIESIRDTYRFLSPLYHEVKDHLLDEDRFEEMATAGNELGVLGTYYLEVFFRRLDKATALSLLREARRIMTKGVYHFVDADNEEEMRAEAEWMTERDQAILFYKAFDTLMERDQEANQVFQEAQPLIPLPTDLHREIGSFMSTQPFVPLPPLPRSIHLDADGNPLVSNSVLRKRALEQDEDDVPVKRLKQ